MTISLVCTRAFSKYYLVIYVWRNCSKHREHKTNKCVRRRRRRIGILAMRLETILEDHPSACFGGWLTPRRGRGEPCWLKELISHTIQDLLSHCIYPVLLSGDQIHVEPLPIYNSNKISVAKVTTCWFKSWNICDNTASPGKMGRWDVSRFYRFQARALRWVPPTVKMESLTSYRSWRSITTCTFTSDGLVSAIFTHTQIVTSANTTNESWGIARAHTHQGLSGAFVHARILRLKLKLLYNACLLLLDTISTHWLRYGCKSYSPLNTETFLNTSRLINVCLAWVEPRNKRK